MKRLNRFVLLALVYPFALVWALSRRVRLFSIFKSASSRKVAQSRRPFSRSLVETLRHPIQFGPINVSVGMLVIFGGMGIGIAGAAANTGALVSAPTSVNATVGQGTVTVTWGIPSDLAGQSSGNYEVQISEDGTTWSGATVGSSPHTFSNLKPVTPYYTRVRAVTSVGGTGAWGYDWELAYKTTTIKRVANEIVYTNTPASTSRTDFTRVRYIMRGNGNYVDLDFSKTLGSLRTNSTNYDNLGKLRVPVPNGVAADQFNLQGAASDMTVATNHPNVSKGQGISGYVEIWPWNYARTGGTDGAYDWQDTPSQDGAYGSFQVHVFNGDTLFAWNNPGATQADFGFGSRSTGDPDWTFAGNSDSISNFSLESYANPPVTTPAAIAPGAPTIGVATSTGTSTATVAFQAPASDGGAAITKYTATSNPAGGTGTLSQAGSGTITMSGLTQNTNYTFTVTATNSVGTSSASSASNSITTAPVTHVITFNANGGTGSMSTQTVNQAIPTPLNANTFAREGYTFRGWNSAANGTGLESFADQGNVTRSAALTLFAMWTSLDDRAWNKGNLDGEYAFLNNEGNPVIPRESKDAFTVEAWVRPDSFPSTWSSLFTQQADVSTSDKRNSIWILNKVVYVVATGTEVSTGYSLDLNRWTHIAWVMTTSTTSQLYIDGQLVWTGNVPTRVRGGTHFAIGGSRQTGHPSFDGNIDQFKVWGVDLTATQVASSMHSYGSFSGAPGSTGTLESSCVTGLRAHYDFNEFNSGVVLDRSGCGRNLSFNTAVTGSYAESNFTSAAIVDTGSAVR